MGRVAVVERRAPQRRVRSRRLAAAQLPHRALRVALWRYVLSSDAATALTAPLVYMLLLPFVLLDLFVSVYQAICFRAWGIARVRRSRYFAIDRHRLAYLNGLERVNCLYCSYANGLLAYVREVAARTEQYWCPIRHARLTRDLHPRHQAFVEYGDADGYRAGLPSLRERVKK